MELLDIVDESGAPTGEVVERTTAHRDGIRHRTAHLWLLRRRNGRIQVLLQKRSACKDSHPGCYDISSAGHIPAGVDYIPSALRELQEELGLTASAEDLHYCGSRQIHYTGEFHGSIFRDEQVTRTYVYWCDVEPEEMHLQESEVESVLWMDYEACVEAVRTNTLNHCIYLEELEMLRSTFE